VLRLLAELMRVRVGEHEDAVVVLDDAELAAQIDGKAGVAPRLQVADADLVAGLEARGCLRFRAGRGTAGNEAGNDLGSIMSLPGAAGRRARRSLPG
jgi:hypothetical protein